MGTAGVDLKMMSYCIMLGTSDYSSPFGYQTNLMVDGLGGYKVRFLLTWSALNARHLSCNYATLLTTVS